MMYGKGLSTVTHKDTKYVRGMSVKERTHVLSLWVILCSCKAVPATELSSCYGYRHTWAGFPALSRQ